MCDDFVTRALMPFQSFIRIFKRYFIVAKWLLGQSVWALKSRILLLMAMAFGAYCCEFGALFLSIATIKQDKHLTNAYEWIGITNNETAVSISLVLLCLIIAAVFGFGSAAQTIRCRRLSQDFATRKAESILRLDEIPLIPVRKNIGAKMAAVRVLRSDPGMVGWVLMLLLRNFVPLGMMLIVFGYLLITQTIFGLIIVGLLAVSIPLILLPNKRAAAASAKMERVASQTAKNTTLFLKSIQNQNKEQSESMETVLAPQLDARDQRMIAIQTSRLIGSFILAGVITLCLAMLLANTSAFADDTTTLVALLATIRLGMTSLRSTNTTITSINRFYTQIRRFAGFTQGISIDGFKIGSPKLSRGIQSDLTVPSGSFIGVLTPVPLDRVSAGWLTLLLFKSAMRDEIYLDCCGENNCSDASITYVNACDNNPQDKVRGIRLLITNDLGLLEGTPLFEAFEVDAKGAVRVLDKDNVFKDLDDTSTEELSLGGDNLEVELEMEMEM